MEIQQVLKQIGLREEEVKVYTKCSQGFFRASEIADSVNLKRTNTYAILDSLIEKGLVNVLSSGKVKKFRAVSISRLYDYIEKKKLELESDKKELDSALKELKSSYSVKRRANVEFYNGIEEVKKFYLDLTSTIGEEKLNCITNFLRYAMVGDVIDEVNQLKKQKFEELSNKYIQPKYIVPNTEQSRDIIRHQKGKIPNYLDLTNFKAVDYKDFITNNHIIIKPGEVTMLTITQTETWAMRFFDKSVIETYNGIFTALWNQGKNLKV
jgi:sugar-specific transcriptional regulator TrmB